MQTPAIHTNEHTAHTYTTGQLQCVLTDSAETPFLQRKVRLRKTITTVCQSKEDMKQWNGDKMRKWSHTFSTCPKMSHPHSPLIDHGSCCHKAHAKLSFLWFKKSDLQRQTCTVILLSIFICLALFLKAIQITMKTVSHSPFPGLVSKKTVQVMGDLSIWQTGKAVFTHTDALSQ